MGEVSPENTMGEVSPENQESGWTAVKNHLLLPRLEL